MEDQPSKVRVTPSESPDPPPTTLVRQPHGGALKRGGNWGNRGGKGRPPSEIREAMRLEFDELIPKLRRMTKSRKVIEKVNGKDVERTIPPDPGIVLQVAGIFARYGMDSAVTIADVRKALESTRTEIFELLPEEMATMLWERISEHWLKL